MGEMFQSKGTDCQVDFFLEKTRSKYSYPQEIHVTFNNRNNLSRKGGEKIYHGNKNHKRYGLPMPISEKAGFNKYY